VATKAREPALLPVSSLLEPPGGRANTLAMDEETEGRLRALGYVA